MCDLTLQPARLVRGKRWDLPRLCMPPSSWLRRVSLWRGDACERRGGSRQEGGGEQGSEGGATVVRSEGGVCSGGRWGTRVNQVQQGRVHSTKNTPKTPISPGERSGNIGRKIIKNREINGKQVSIQHAGRSD